MESQPGWCTERHQVRLGMLERLGRGRNVRRLGGAGRVPQAALPVSE